ncbi:DUF305 domain-containing protein [Streptomyces sp. NPDC001985]|uniref:DUF305 domain-containing protein n=1 Tax=Streptomyces sp. NPDC001985 TaxID=3154406 RepID=UPI003329581C
MPNRRRTPATRGPAAVAAVAVAVLALGACESGSGGAEPGAGKGPEASVVVPGKPGEPARTLSAEDARKELPDDSPNEADLAYAHRMIEHHRQALTMTGLVPGRVHSPRVEALAERISAGQEPEIAAMEGWLESEGGSRAGDGGGQGGHGDHGGGHDAGSMPGMATGAQLAQLRAAEGKAFDELFLKLMITHHEGAISMAAEVLADGNNVRVEEMAGDVIASQTTEIGRMRGL